MKHEAGSDYYAESGAYQSGLRAQRIVGRMTAVCEQSSVHWPGSFVIIRPCDAQEGIPLPGNRLIQPSCGFTLLEMLVVLAIMALALGIILPRLDALASGVGAAYERETVIEAVASLGLVARAQAQRIEFDGDLASLPGELPDGWQAFPEEPILFHASGACDGGRVRVAGREREFVYQLAPPRCRATLVD